ncbi:MAG: ATP-binding cassette domain-containing protein [bacterium]|nr:ATP-binding cassette domain-containing protein [bacterium]
MCDPTSLFEVLSVLAEYQGFGLTRPHAPSDDLDQVITETARCSRIGFRKVHLESGWHRGDVGALLGTIEGRPVALIPAHSGRGYLISDGSHLSRLTDSQATTVAEQAFEFYPGIPSDTQLNRLKLARFAVAGSGRTVGLLLVAATMIALLGLLSPIAVKHVFGSVILAGEKTLLYSIGLLLAGAALASGSFAVVQGFAISRISLKAQGRLQPAVWYRVVSLPASFFRKFASGELTSRVLGVNSLKILLSSSVVGLFLSATFSLLNLVIILLFDPLLAAVAVVVVLVVLAVTWRIGSKVMRLASDVVVQGRANDAHFSDVLEGLTAIRVSGSEEHFYRRHIDMVARKVKLEVCQQHQSNRLHLFYATLVIAVPGLFFLVVGTSQWDPLLRTYSISPVTFVAFMAAFNTILGAFLALSSVIHPLSVAGPILDGISPFLETAPEAGSNKADPGVLSGEIEFRDVSFRHPNSRRQTLEEVSFKIEAGQLVALVGPSGAGKSTIVRLLLGFETPERGSVLYDGQNLQDHDISAIRSQLGVVLQEAHIFAGSIRDNVAGARPVGLAEVWEAVDNSGIGDDIRAMPMGLETIVSPGGSAFSGGQLQRLMIARALIAKPRILILDEATSSLDDLTQKRVAEHIDGLNVTRIILAHRLNTIRNADQILVADAGRIVEQGSYHELMAMNGLFSRLVERQVV